MASWSDQDVRINNTSVMSKKFWLSDRAGLDMTPGFRSGNFEVAYLQGTMWRAKQLSEVVRSVLVTIDSCDEDGNYPVGRMNRIAQLNSNRMEFLALIARENAQVTVERDVLISDGMGGHTTETWTGYAQASTPIVPQSPDDFDDFQTMAVDLLFSDPTWYGAENTPTVSGTTTVNNPGTIDATNMVLNFTGGSNYRLTNQTADPDHWVQIDYAGSIEVDVRNGTAYAGTTNVIGYLSKDGGRDFMRLAPGDNTMVLTGGGSCQITFKTPRA